MENKKRKLMEPPAQIPYDEVVAALGEPTRQLTVHGQRITLYCGDASDLCKRLPPSSIDVILTSPPYNIGKNYKSAHTDDSKDDSSYVRWLREWMRCAGDRLAPDGSMWLNLGYNKERTGTHVPIAYRIWDASPDLVLRQEIVWRFTRGVACRLFFSPRHETILWYQRRTDARPRFHLDAVREEHDQSSCTCGTRNGRKRCNSLGKNPGDVWFMQTVTAGKDRAAAERVAHPTQMPIALADRMVQATRKEGGILLDPFAGSGTSLLAATHAGMDAIGFDISAEYIDLIEQRATMDAL